MRSCLRGGIGILLTLTVLVGQALGSIETAQIYPEHPTTVDVVVVTVSGWWGSSCVPNDSAAYVDGFDIYFDAIWDYPPDIVCATVMTPWDQTQSVGPLPQGIYNVYARVTGHPYYPETYSQVAVFVVTDYQFVLSTHSVVVPEGQPATFTVALLSDPCEPTEVDVNWISGDTDIAVQSGATLYFDSSNYSTPQPVTLFAAEDEDYLNGEAAIAVSTTGFVTAEVLAVESDNYPVPQVLYVDVDANGNDDGTNWSNAFVDLQDALALAAYTSAVSEIRVAEGVYRPAGYAGAPSAKFQLMSSVAVRGGYAGFNQDDPNTRDIERYETVLSGDLNGDDGDDFENNAENSWHVVTGSGTDNTALFEGFTITAGRGGHGAGMFNAGSETAPVVSMCTFKSNSAAYGAAIACENSASLTLLKCKFSSNKASWYGGAIHCWTAGYLVVSNSVFTNNSAGEGGGIFSFNTDCTLTNCIFAGNSAVGGDRKEGHGGGFYNNIGFPGGQTAVITNCTFFGNSAVAVAGGGVYDSCYLYDNLILTNSILWDNTDSMGADEAAQICSDNKPAVVDYCCIQGWTGARVGVDNFDADPRFVDPCNGDYRLLPDSPCIDVGDPNYIAAPNETDLDGCPRIIDGNNDGLAIIDMGAYEYLPPIEADVRITPRVLNPRSRGRFILAFIRLPEPHSVTDIDQSSVMLEGQIPAGRTAIIESRNVALARFNCRELLELTPGRVELTITGRLNDQTPFEGTDTIRINSKPPK